MNSDLNRQALVSLGRSIPEAEIEMMERPDWDSFFMAHCFLAAMRSPDRQTKQGCIIVDWPSKTILGGGYNGHPRGVEGLPVYRKGTKLLDGSVQGDPCKYAYMVLADVNALGQVTERSEHTVVYLTQPPCELCLGQMLNSKLITLRKILFFEDRNYKTAWDLIERHNKGCVERGQVGRMIEMVRYNPFASHAEGRPNALELLEQAAQYMRIRQTHGQEVSRASIKTYR